MRFIKYRTVFIIVITVIMIIAISISIYHNNISSSISHVEQGITNNHPDSIYFRNLDNECSNLTKAELLNRKRFAEEVVKKLESNIKSDTLNPEERHEAIITRNNIRREMDIYIKYLK